MPIRINGASTSMQNLTADLQFYMCCAASPGAFTNPMPNPPADQQLQRLINIQTTGNPQDQSQKNFEILLMSIGLRAMPVVLSDPEPVADLTQFTHELSGEGFVWKFGVERGVQFYNFTPYKTPGPVGLLIDDLDGVILPSGVRLTTVTGSPSGWPINAIFFKVGY